MPENATGADLRVLVAALSSRARVLLTAKKFVKER